MGERDRSVREATPADSAALAALAVRAITTTGPSAYDAEQIATWSSSFTTEALEHLVASQSVFVVEVGDELAGFASLAVGDDSRAVVDQLYVDPSFVGRGVAGAAIAAVESEARGRKITELWADASLLAAPVFEHLGYEVVERYVKARGDATFPNTWLVKHLT